MVVTDFRGQGRSETGSGHYTIPLLSHDTAALLDAIGVGNQPVHVVGFSLGAAVGLQLALDHPSKVKSLTITGFVSAYEANWLGWFISQPTMIRLLGMYNFGVLAGDAVKASEKTKREFSEILMMNDVEGYIKTANADTDMEAAKRAAKGEQGEQGVVASQRYFNLTSRLPELRMPVLNIHAEFDDLAGFTYDLKKKDMGLVENGRLVEVAGVSHFLPLDDEVQWNRLVLDFVKEIDSGKVTITK